MGGRVVQNSETSSESVFPRRGFFSPKTSVFEPNFTIFFFQKGSYHRFPNIRAAFSVIGLGIFHHPIFADLENRPLLRFPAFALAGPDNLHIAQDFEFIFCLWAKEEVHKVELEFMPCFVIYRLAMKVAESF